MNLTLNSLVRRELDAATKTFKVTYLSACVIYVSLNMRADELET